MITKFFKNNFLTSQTIAFLLFLVSSVFAAGSLIQNPKYISSNRAALIGDVNADGKVDILDFQLLSNSFGKSQGQSGYEARCDFNNSYNIDILDFQILSNNFGKTAATNTPTRSVSITPTKTSSPTPNTFSPAPTQPPAGFLRAFPGAEGFGSRSKGGRGGTVYRVTNLNDSGTGSLRACAEASGPRYCLFETSGTIRLSKGIYIRNPYITIAGETAPSPGITIRGETISMNATDIIIRHLRFRIGEELGEVDGFRLQGPNGKNSIVDHVSVSWGVDENLSMWYANAENITYQNVIVSEALNNSVHSEGAHSKGILVGDGIRNVSLINILAAHNVDRNFLAKGGSTAESINNLYYNAADPRITLVSMSSKATVVGNVYIKGPNTSATSRPVVVDGGTIWVSDIKTEGLTGSIAASNTATKPVWSGLTSPDPSSAVESMLYQIAGARPKDRDSVDIRIINEIKNRSGRIIDNTSQVGGWPNLVVNKRAFPIPGNPNGDDDNDGYTNLEEILHQYAAALQ